MSSILLIEDNELMRGLVSEWLESAGYAVRHAASGRAALAQLERHPAALVMVDVALPKYCGRETVELLRRKHPQVPIIATSAHFRPGLGRAPAAAEQLGARCLLAKPFSRSELLEAIENILGQNAGQAG
jgi:CheY-like chemotaxis protein